MQAILQHCYFKAPLFHFKTSLVRNFSIGSSESLSDMLFLDISGVFFLPCACAQQSRRAALGDFTEALKDVLN